MNVPIFAVPSLKARGIALGVCILVKERLPEVIAHEQVHIRQQWQGWILGFVWRYFMWKNWRARYEAEAFAASIKHGMQPFAAVRSLYSNYNLGLSEAKCRELIESYR